MKYSNEFKKSLLESGVFNEYCTAKKQYVYDDDGVGVGSFLIAHGYDAYQACKSLSDCKWHKKQKIEKRFEKVVECEKAIFLTLTFTDEVLEKTNEETRAKYVKRFLKSQCAKYVANIDFGAKKEREHYHALVMPLDGSISLKEWHKYGGIKAERVKNTEKDCEKVSKYVAKLSNHALKNTGRMPRIIFSRGWRQMSCFYDENLELLPF